VAQYLGGYAHTELGISCHDLLALGRQNAGDASEPFNMAYLAIRCCGAVNGVSRLHGKISRHLFEPIFQRWPEDEVPVGHVTNGVHMPTWDSAMADDLWTQACGKDRWLGTAQALEQNIRQVCDADLWQFRSAARRSLVEYARQRLSRQLAIAGASPETVEEASHLFDYNTLTLGFARRFASYKRPNLLLHDPERLLRLLNHPQRPVQLIMAGKAHPADLAGQALIQQWTLFTRRPEARHHVIFLGDYDMHLTEQLVQGADVWLNTPRRPWEACGTSGMKVLVNGGLNLSELDGWWAEAYAPEVGWALGDGLEHDADPAWDAVEAEALYQLLEDEVIPAFYTRDERGIPAAWASRMRESMARLTPRFSSSRAVSEYTVQHYLPGASAYLARAANQSAVGIAMVNWQHDLNQKWSALRFGEMKVDSDASRHLIEVQLYLGDLDPSAVQVELYANGVDGSTAQRVPMHCVRQLVGASCGYAYGAEVPTTRHPGDYTARVVPRHAGVAIPLEAGQILWQR
jgi:starch phosphorylase